MYTWESCWWRCESYVIVCVSVVFFFKQKTAYELRISYWSSDVCSSYLISLRGSVDTSIGTISSLTAYLKTQLDISADGDASPAEIISFTIDSPDKNFTQELNFASEKFGPVSFVAGLFYHRDDSSYDPLVGAFPAPFLTFPDDLKSTRLHSSH